MNTFERKLRLTLKINAAFSLVSGMVAMIFRSELSYVMNISVPDILLYIGIGLALFGIFVFIQGFKQILNYKAIKSIIFQDWIWVIGSAVITIFQIANLSRLGYIVIVAIAVIVAGFATFQAKYLREFDG